MRRALVVVLLIGVVVLGMIWALQRRMIYFPEPSYVPPVAAVLPAAHEVTLRTSDGLALGAWHLPAADGRPTVLVANGNGGSRALRAPLAEALARHGLGVLLFDYRGYGGNPGSPSESGLALDARAAYRFLVEEAGVSLDRLLYFGESIGAAVVAELATEHPPAGLVLRSPFTDLASVGQHHYPFLPVRAFLRDRYPVMEHVARVKVPTTVVYGTADSIVPPSFSRTVAEAAPSLARLVAVEGADHNDLALLDGRQLIDAILEIAGP